MKQVRKHVSIVRAKPLQQRKAAALLVLTRAIPHPLANPAINTKASAKAGFVGLRQRTIEP
jgi:hypothetical protein